MRFLSPHVATSGLFTTYFHPYNTDYALHSCCKGSPASSSIAGYHVFSVIKVLNLSFWRLSAGEPTPRRIGRLQQQWSSCSEIGTDAV